MIRMKANPALTAIVPAASIYPQTTTAVPPYPFIRCGSPIGVPIIGSCVDGMIVTLAVHGFSTGRYVDQQLIETAEDHASRIGAAIAASLDKAAFDIPGGKAKVRWTGPQLLQDPEEANAFHTVQNFQVRCITG
jgi:hypothetical protein